MYYLDPPDQAPQEFFAKAVRYNWPAGSELVPVWLVAGPDGPTDLDQLHVRRFTVAIAAVLAYERNSAAKTTGEVALADGRSGTFSIS